jgi:hypothetical protein
MFQCQGNATQRNATKERVTNMTTATKKTIVLHVGDFVVERLGVEYPDYFQGYGLGPKSDYDYCAYGIGDTESEALDDCLEQAAAQGFDFDEETEERIRDEFGDCDEETTAAEYLGIDDDSEDSTFADFPAYYHIGIKWNSREKARLERIRQIPNLEFLSYEDYRQQGRDSRYNMPAWGYTYRADGDVSYGDMKSADCPESADDYLRALPEDDTEPGEIYFYVPCAGGSDYSGSTVERANYEVFVETYGDNDFVFSAYGGHGTYAVAVGLTGLLGCDEALFDEVCNVLEGLEDYPLIDDEALSTLEMKGADEAWESWVAGDFRRAMEKKFDDCAEFEWPEDSALREFFEEKREKANTYWENEGYGHDMYVRIDDVVACIDFEDIEDWAVRYVVSFVDVGEEKETYFLESEASERVDTLRASGSIGAHYTVVAPDHSANS